MAEDAYQSMCLPDDVLFSICIPSSQPTSHPPPPPPRAPHLPPPHLPQHSLAPHLPPHLPSDGLSLDPEQDAVVRHDLATSELLCVVAAAGSGKSTTLREYVRARPHIKFLYLSYGREDCRKKKEEFAQQGLRHVDVMTTHVLARGATKDIHTGRIEDFRIDFKTNLLETNGQAPKNHVAASKTVESLIGGFCASVDREIEWRHIDSKRLLVTPTAIDGNGWDAVACARRIWQVMTDPCDPRMRLTHDGYLKAFQLDAARQREQLHTYDVVLLDEAQDCTAAQIDIVTNAAAQQGCIVVYDPHQCIYQFRGAQDARVLDSLPGATRRHLRRTHRYGAPLSDAASRLIRYFKGEADFQITGNPRHATSLARCTGVADALERVRSSGRSGGTSGPVAALTRFNRTIVTMCVELLAACGQSVRVAFATSDAGVCPRHRECCDVAFLDLGPAYWPQIQDRFVRKFAAAGRGMEAFRKSVEHENKVGNHQSYADALALRDQYGSHPLLMHMQTIEQRTEVCTERADVLFATTHRSKGLGFAHVVLGGDFLARGLSVGEAIKHVLDAEAKKELHGYGRTQMPSSAELLRCPIPLFELLQLSAVEEVNTLYVAMTRAVHQLYVPDVLASWLAYADIDVPDIDVPGAETGAEMGAEVGVVMGSQTSAYDDHCLPDEVLALLEPPTSVQRASRAVAEEEEEVQCVGERTLEERNAAGFAAAIDVDAAEESAAVVGKSTLDSGGGKRQRGHSGVLRKLEVKQEL